MSECPASSRELLEEPLVTEELFDPRSRRKCDSYLSSPSVDSRATATPSAVQASHASCGHVCRPGGVRGRSTNVQVYDVDLPTNSCGTTCRARGLRAGSDGFDPGAFIGFYTGRWGTRKSLGGANAYMLDAGDDEHYVAPPGARSRRVDLGVHAMAAINEPNAGVCMPRPARRAAPPVRAHTRACAVVRWLQEVANACTCLVIRL